MPRPDVVTPRAAADAPHGSTAELQRLAGAAPTRTPSAPPSAPAATPAAASPATSELPGGDLNDGFDPYLFGDTQRPNEPITSGVAFGAGANFVPRRTETPKTFLRRVADELEASPSAGPETKRLIERIRRGE